MKMNFRISLLFSFLISSLSIATPCDALKIRTYTLHNPNNAPKVSLTIGRGFQSISINGKQLSAHSRCEGEHIWIYWGEHTGSLAGEIHGTVESSDCPCYLGLRIYQAKLNGNELPFSFLETPGLYDSGKH